MNEMKEVQEQKMKIRQEIERLREEMRNLNPQSKEYRQKFKQIEVYQSQLDDLNNENQLDLIKLQQQMNNLQQAIEFATNIQKTSKDISTSLLRNIG